jgi:hypothetical protein
MVIHRARSATTPRLDAGRTRTPALVDPRGGRSAVSTWPWTVGAPSTRLQRFARSGDGHDRCPQLTGMHDVDLGPPGRQPAADPAALASLTNRLPLAVRPILGASLLQRSVLPPRSGEHPLRCCRRSTTTRDCPARRGGSDRFCRCPKRRSTRPQSSVEAVSLRASSGRSTRSSRVDPRTTPRTPAGTFEAASAPAFGCRAIAP